MPINPQTYNVMFIDERALKEQSVLNDNIDMKILTPTIKLCQEKYLTKILGTALYVDLQNKIFATVNNVSGSTQLNDDEKFLLNAFIQPTLVWLIMQDAPLYITYKFLNKGVATQSSDTSNPATLGEIQSFQNTARNNADWYTQKLMTHLIANQPLFPAYMQAKSYEDVIPDTRGYKTGIYLGNGFGNNRNYRGLGRTGGCDNCDPWIYYR